MRFEAVTKLFEVRSRTIQVRIILSVLEWALYLCELNNYIRERCGLRKFKMKRFQVNC